MPDPKETTIIENPADDKKIDIVDEEVKIIGTDPEMEEEKSTEISNRVIDKFKKGLSQAFEAGAKVVDNLSQTAQGYAEKYKTESEIKKLKGERDLLITSLGHNIFKQYCQKGKISESFFNGEGIIGQLNQIELLDKKIINDGKRLDNIKE